MSSEIIQAQRSAERAADAQPAFGRLIPLGVILAVMAFAVVMGWHRYVSLETLVRHHSAIAELVAAHRVVASLAFVAVYGGAVALSFPGATLLTIAGGAIFGAVTGGIAAVSAATLGATGIFLVTKLACGCIVDGRWMRRAAPLAGELAAGFRKDAFWYLIFLRLVPLFPFWLVNLIAAPAGVALTPFIAATAIGIIPATFAFAFFGAGLSSVVMVPESAYRACVAAGQEGCRLDFDLQAAVTPDLIGGLAGLALIALVPPFVRYRGALRARANASPGNADTARL